MNRTSTPPSLGAPPIKADHHPLPPGREHRRAGQKLLARNRTSTSTSSARPPIESPSPPALSSWGRRACPERAQRVEGCRQADEGAFTRMSIARGMNGNLHATPSSALGPASVNRAYLLKRPPHPPSEPSPPARNRGGRRALDLGCRQFHSACEKCRLTRHRVNGYSPSPGVAAR